MRPLSITFVLLVLLSTLHAGPKNPIMFVTAVPNCCDSATLCSVIANHSTSFTALFRGGDLWIRYPNGHLRNLTAMAGYGAVGFQGLTSIAVRQPCVHWSGKKALFSMVQGAYLGYKDNHIMHWQIFEVSGLGEQDSVIITKIEPQPDANNVSPIYATDDKIIFVSDRNREGSPKVDGYVDENQAMDVNSGLWKLDPKTGECHQLDHSPSGDYNASLDSYGRVVFSRWDVLQHDPFETQHAPDFLRVDLDGESASARPSTTFSNLAFPEINPKLALVRTHVVQGDSYFGGNLGKTTVTEIVASRLGTEGTILDPCLPSSFTPWTINEDGTGLQTVNHIGRHDLRDTIPHAVSDELNLEHFSASRSSRPNKNSITNALQLREDPLHPGSYYGIDALPAGTHGAGQIIRLDNLAPKYMSRDLSVQYITSRSTRTPIPDSAAGPSDHSGFYRNPLPTSDGLLIASHCSTKTAEAKALTIDFTTSFEFRLKTLRQEGDVWVADEALTPGISKAVSFPYIYSPYNPIVGYNGLLWELDAVEVVSRTIPEASKQGVAELERKVFEEEGVDLAEFQSYLRSSNQALIVMRDLRQRDPDDKLQPYLLAVPRQVLTDSADAEQYSAIGFLSLFQGDYITTHKAIASGKTQPGRRICAVPQHEVSNTVNDLDGSPATVSKSMVRIYDDGSAAAFLPARRAVTWQTDKGGSQAVVRERYWLCFAPGEIRTCGRCHGENDKGEHFYKAAPTNTATALRGLLNVWKMARVPAKPTLVSPQKAAKYQVLPIVLTWHKDTAAVQYEVHVRTVLGTTTTEVCTKVVNAPDTTFELSSLSPAPAEAIVEWSVRSFNKYGASAPSITWNFSTYAQINDVEPDRITDLEIRPQPGTNAATLEWYAVTDDLVTIQVHNSIGLLVYKQSTQGREGTNQAAIDLRDWASGVYWLSLQHCNQLLRKALVVSK